MLGRPQDWVHSHCLPPPLGQAAGRLHLRIKHHFGSASPIRPSLPTSAPLARRLPYDQIKAYPRQLGRRTPDPNARGLDAPSLPPPAAAVRTLLMSFCTSTKPWRPSGKIPTPAAPVAVGQTDFPVQFWRYALLQIAQIHASAPGSQAIPGSAKLYKTACLIGGQKPERTLN